MKPASLCKRSFAYIIDLLIISLIIVVPLKRAFSDLDQLSGLSITEAYSLISTSQLSSKIFLLTLVSSLLYLLYFSLLDYFASQTVGKLIFKIKVVSKTKRLKFSQCLLRNITKISVLLVALDTLYLIINKTHQRYLEKISNTEVVEA